MSCDQHESSARPPRPSQSPHTLQVFPGTPRRWRGSRAGSLMYSRAHGGCEAAPPVRSGPSWQLPFGLQCCKMSHKHCTATLMSAMVPAAPAHHCCR